MRLSHLTGLAALLALASPSFAQTTNLAFWNFNDGTADGGQTDASVRAALLSVDGGLNAASATMTTDFNTRNAASNLADGINTFTGSNIGNLPPGAGSAVPAGQALGLQGGIQNFPNDASSVVNNGHSITFAVSTVGFDTVSVSFATRGTAAGFTSDQFQVSTDGATFTNFSSAYNPQSTTFFAQTFDLSGVAGLADNPNAAFRIVFDGATSPLGNNRIDNLQVNAGPIGVVTAAPEPAAMSLALVGLGGLGLMRPRRRLSR